MTAPKQSASKGAKKRAGARTRSKPGDTIEKTFRGKLHKVTVTETGFRHGRKEYASLTAVARRITGYKSISGPAFFGLTKKGDGA